MGDGDILETCGKVMVCNDAPFYGKWFYVNNGIKRWITTIDAAVDNGIDITKLENTSIEEIKKYKNGMFIIKNIRNLDDIENIYEARAYFLKDLKGYGIEFGAATSPSPLPDNCIVDYADYFQVDDGCNRDFMGEFVSIKFLTGLDEMEGIKNSSFNFIINCHVIEHVPRTILALKKCYDKLKKGGILFMVVPHKEYTFDVLRPLTSLSHFIEDYNNYIKERDVIHIVDHFEHFNEYEAKRNNVIAGRVNLFPFIEYFLAGNKIDIHYHTFTEENFTELLNYFNTNIARWGKTEIIPRIPFEDSNEFYVRLTK
jgi:SAM-dependent methyltransferase